MEGRVPDVEHTKMSALERLMDPFVANYDASYTRLRKSLRDVVTSGDYQLPPPTFVKREDGDDQPVVQPIFQAQTPAQWIQAHVAATGGTRFNVKSFLRDARLGFLEHEPQHFLDLGKASPFLHSLQQFVGTYERDAELVEKHFMFNLKKTDDLFARFAEHNHEQTDLMLVVHKIGVLFSRHCILLRMWINDNLPNLAMWLSMVEKLEILGERKLVSPPPAPPPPPPQRYIHV